MSQNRLHDILDSDVTDCEGSAYLKQSDSDSDRTVDSKELEEIIKNERSKSSTVNLKDKPSQNASHEISDSDVTDCEEEYITTYSNQSLNKDVQPEKLPSVKSQNSTEGSACNSKSNLNSNLPECKYGHDCYRKNLEHLKNFRHPEGKGSSLNSTVSTAKKQKLDRDANFLNPIEILNYNLYFTKVTGISNSYNNFRSIHISEILSPQNGALIASVQFNYVIDISWLMQQYPSELRSKPLLVVHGHKDLQLRTLVQSAAAYRNVSFCQAKLEIAFGTHHTKMMLLHYQDGFRVVIHTSNLIEQDWKQKTQGAWISEKYRLLPENSVSSGDSAETNFKRDLMRYLESYGDLKLKPWVDLIRKYDFSSTKVHLIASVPGRFRDNDKCHYGHLRLRKILKECGPKQDIVDSSWYVIGQFSSIGSLGKDASQWLRGEWLQSLSSARSFMPASPVASLKLVFPSVDDVRSSLEGYPAGASLPYSKNTAYRQPYLNSYLHRWKSELHGRTHAAPHIKSYMRVSADNKQIAWFLMTSANLSKAAWGALEKNGSQLMIRSYELGVLFLPHSFKKSTFEVLRNKSDIDGFAIPFDLPLVKYTSQDKPWTWDEAHKEKPDRHGNMWCPP